MSVDRWVRQLERGTARVVTSWLGARRRLLDRKARKHRLRLGSTAVVGVTGSGGKTTTKELIAAVLSSRLTGTASPASHNAGLWLPRTVLGVRPGDDFCVVELAAFGPGTLDYGIELVRPTLAVVTSIGQDHRSRFRTLEATAEEKGKLVAALPRQGTAILNADDPLVLGMERRCAGRVVTYGLTERAMLRATDVSAAWPERLSLRAHWESQSVEVKTRLCGAHWASAVLAALATGVVMGVPLEEAARSLAQVEPVLGRMSVRTAGGVTFIRDDDKAPYWSLGTVFDFLRSARATRKIAVIGTISDLGKQARSGYARAARQALDVADRVIFVGSQARYADGAVPGRESDLLVLDTVQEASRFLEGFLREGDLVLLKGSRTADHLGRLALARTGDVRCWRARCGKQRFCEECVLVRVPLGPGSLDTPVWGRRRGVQS